MKKIKISSSWDSSENLTNRLIKQFKTSEIDLIGIEFVYDDSYDIIVFFNHATEIVPSNKKGYIFPHEPSWSGSHQKNIPNNITIFGFKKELYNQNCQISISHTFYGGRGPWVDSLEFWCYDNLINFTPTKTKNLSSSVTDLKDSIGETCLYPQRYLIHQLISNIDFIDCYGGGDCSPKRHDSLIDYKFNLAIENEYQDNWITEKFYDSVLTETIPIYYGCKNIKEIYPEDGYILIKDINNATEIKELLTYINNNTDEIYNQKIEGLRQIKKRYLKEFNLLKKIIEL